MPTYEFQCQECGEKCEELLPMGKSIKKCPACGKPKLKKLISCPNYHDTYSPMHPRRGRGVGGYGRVEPGEGAKDFGSNLG